MKIVYITPHLSTGGMPEYLRKKIELLHKDNEIWVFEMVYEKQYTSIREKIAGIIGSNLISLDQNYKKLFDLLQKISPDIVHFEETSDHFLPHPLLDKIYSSTRTWKIFETLHDSSIDHREKKYLPDKMLVVSLWQVKNFLPLGIPIEIIEHEITPGERNRELGMKTLGLDPEKKHVLQVGLFSNRKNQRFTFSLARLMPDVQFHFVGALPDNYRDHWQDLVDNKPPNCVIWKERSDVHNFYSCMDAVIFPSEGKYGDTETNPLAIKEAIAWDIPLFLRNIPVYMNGYQESSKLKWMAQDLEENSKILYSMLNLINNYTLIKPDFLDQKLFEIQFDKSDNKLTINYLHDIPFDMMVCIRDLDTEVPIYSFDARFENKNNYWTIPLPKSYYDFSENPNFSGFLVDFYDPGGNLLYSQSYQIKFIDTQKKKFRIDTYEPVFVNFEQFFTDKIYDKFFSQIEDLDLVLDIGSSVGLFTELAKDKGAKKIVAFEVSDRATKIFNNLHGEDFRVELIKMAVWDKKETIKIYEDLDNSIISSAITKTDKYFEIQSIDLNSFFHENRIEKVSLMKMDIEGSEYKAFDGLSDENLLKIENIILEFHDNVGKVLRNKILKRLINLGMGYQIYKEDCITHSDGISDEKGVVFISTNKNLLKNLSPLNFLEIYNTEFNKIRMGSENDGGYILADGLEYDAFISCGLANNIDFENDFMKKYSNIDVYLFDGTVENIPETTRECKWEKKNISQNKNENEENLHDLIKKYKNVFIKMDIEASEFFWIDAMPEDLLSNISQIVIEFHYLFSEFIFFDGRETIQVEKKLEIFRKLLKTHKLIHLSPNNCCEVSLVDGVVVPNVFECTFIRRDLCKNNTLNNLMIPGKLDRKNHQDRNFIVLNHYPFVTNDRYYENSSTIVIIDCFVSSPRIEKRLIDQIKRFKDSGFDILLVSNTTISKEIQDLTDYYFYDKRNQLFSENYSQTQGLVINDYVFSSENNWVFTLKNSVSGIQKHGLSVMINFHNAATFAKSLGYQNLIRIECDDLYGKNSLDWIKKSTIELENSDQKCVVFFNNYNDDRNFEESNISFHLQIWNIDFFLETMPKFSKEQDYIDFIERKFSNRNFLTVEVLFRRLLDLCHPTDLVIHDGREMEKMFPDTVWNTEASLSYFYDESVDFFHSAYRREDDGRILFFSRNLTNNKVEVNIVVRFDSGNKETIIQDLPDYQDSWCWNLLDSNLESWKVYYKDELISGGSAKDLKNWVEFPKNN